MRQALDDLAPENAAAWSEVHLLGSRAVQELGLAGEVFRQVTVGEGPEAVRDRLARYDEIWAHLVPAKTTQER